MKKAPSRLTSNGLCEKLGPPKNEDSIAVWLLFRDFLATFGVLDKGGIPKVIHLRGQPPTGSTWHHFG